MDVANPTHPVVYVSHHQFPSTYMHLVIRTDSPPLGLVEPVQQAVRRVDPGQHGYGVQTMEAAYAASLDQPRFSAVLLWVFAALAVVLSAVGVYGVVSCLVAERTQEIGIRLALGARTRDVWTLVTRDVAMVALAGVFIGLVGAFAMRTVLASLVYGVSATDAGVLFGTALLLFGVVAAAAGLPARRATRVDPMLVLRAE